MRLVLLLFAVVALAPPARAQRPGAPAAPSPLPPARPAPASAAGLVEPMPVRWLGTVADALSLYTLAAEPSGGVVALVREDNATAVVWLSASGEQTRRVALPDAPNNSLMTMARLPDGTVVLGGTCPQGRDWTPCTRSIAPGAARARPAVRLRDGASVDALAVGAGGDLLVALENGTDSGVVVQTNAAGAVRWRYAMPGQNPTAFLPLGAGGALVSTVDARIQAPGTLVRLDASGRARWTRAVPWQPADAEAFVRTIAPNYVRPRSAPPVRSAPTDVFAAPRPDGAFVAVATAGGHPHTLPLLFAVGADGQLLDAPRPVVLRELWSQGRMPYVGWQPGLFTTGVAANPDGTATLAVRYIDADGIFYNALARVRPDGTLVRGWWISARERLVATPAGWYVAQKQAQGYRVGRVEGTP